MGVRVSEAGAVTDVVTVTVTTIGIATVIGPGAVTGAVLVAVTGITAGFVRLLLGGVHGSIIARPAGVCPRPTVTVGPPLHTRELGAPG